MQTLQRLLLFCSSFLYYCSIIIKNSFWGFFSLLGLKSPHCFWKYLEKLTGVETHNDESNTQENVSYY